MVELNLQQCKNRFVDVNYQGDWKHFQALRYEEDGKKCILQGPIIDKLSRNVQEERLLTVAIKDIRFADGTPVICHGLKDAMSHLNGKIGDTRSWVEKDNSYEIQFEGKDLEMISVKHENVRILFELPDELTP